MQSERDLRRSVADTLRRELAHAQQFPEPRTLAREPGIERLPVHPELLPELERMAGPQSYERTDFPIGPDLLGEAQRVVPITLEEAIRSAVANNLAVQFARLQPAIAEAQVVAAQGAFDWVLLADVNLQTGEQPRVQTFPGAPAVDERRAVTTQAGLRRPLPSGGQFAFQQDLNYTDIRTPGVDTSAREVAWTFRFDQPLLRGFGTDVNLASVRLARNFEREQVAALKGELIRIIFETEIAYWQLVQAQYDVLILHRLHERGAVTRDQVEARELIDATPAQIADAWARVERRAGDVLRAQSSLRLASDSLKALVNHPDLPVGDEVLLVPVDTAIDAPISFSVADVLIAAMRHRPEVHQAILSIDNTSIRQLVADNARLPRLDLRLQSRLAGVRDSFGDAYSDVLGADFVDWLVGFTFEQPLGYRAGEAVYRQRRLERMQATIAYRNTIQQIVLELKQAMRLVSLNYRLIEQTRVSRYAEAENLRSFLVERAIEPGFTVGTLDLEFRRQEQLAFAEREEIQALTEYNAALAQLYAAMGMSLAHNQIQFDVPDADELLEVGGLHTRHNPVVPTPHRRPRLEPRLPAPWWRGTEGDDD